MAAPVIDSVTPPSASLAPGAFVDVVVTAHDPDSAAGSVTFPVTDSTGLVTNAHLDLTINDTLTFGPADAGGLNVTVQKIASTPTSATYRVTAA